MKTSLITFITLLFSFNLIAQIENVSLKYDLPSEVEETSGLLFFNGKLITHNDSGGDATLYELDTISGAISRTIAINNATNVDWEDISQDETYIYIGDIGNNNGNRQDLKIYRILKSEFTNNTSVAAETISFSYEDQTDFTANPFNHDFDAEAFSVYQNELIIFSKNWKTSEVKAYSIPKTIGNHSATKIGSYNSNGLITGSTYNTEDNSFLLSGYNTSASPFIIYLANVDIQHIFNGSIERTELITTVGLGSQIEGITVIDKGKYFLSREKVNTVVNNINVIINQSLFRFDNGSFKTLGLQEASVESFTMYPNPTEEFIQIKGIQIKSLTITDLNGKVLIEQKKSSNQIRIKELATGIYFLKAVTTNGLKITKKFIKS